MILRHLLPPRLKDSMSQAASSTHRATMRCWSDSRLSLKEGFPAFRRLLPSLPRVGGLPVAKLWAAELLTLA